MVYLFCEEKKIYENIFFKIKKIIRMIFIIIINTFPWKYFFVKASKSTILSSNDNI